VVYEAFADVSPSHDPANVAFRFESDWYRVADGESTTLLDELLSTQDPQISTILDSIIPLRVTTAEESQKVLTAYRLVAKREVPARAKVFHVASVPVVLYPWEWTNTQLRAVAEFTLALRIQLLQVGLDLKDASAYNVQFVNGQPTLVDVGSLTYWDKRPGWCALRQFVEHFINPLAVGQLPNVCASDAWLLGGGNGLRSPTARDLLPFKARLSLRLKLLHLATTSQKQNRSESNSLENASELSLSHCQRAAIRLTKNLARLIRGFSSPRRVTTWNSYSDRSHYSASELARKYELLRDFVAINARNCETILDIGSNDGATARRLSDEFGCRVVAVDADIGALELLEKSIEASPRAKANITPVRADLLHSSFFESSFGSELRPLPERIVANIVVCEAVVHHLVITRGKPLSDVVRILRQFGPLLYLEVPTEEDEKVKQLIRQIHNWKGEYSVECLIRELRRNYNQVEILGRVNNSRLVISAHA